VARAEATSNPSQQVAQLRAASNQLNRTDPSQATLHDALQALMASLTG